MPDRKNGAPKSSILEGVKLSRTLAPILPTNFLSRKHLFPLFSEKSPGATLLVAPAGYGKTTLVAEYSQHTKNKIIWTQLNKQDTYDSLATHMIQSVRNVIPGFAPWVNSIRHNLITETIRQVSNELLEINEKLTWVLDNAEELPEFFIEQTREFLNSIPNNLHLIVISRTPPEASYSRFAALGNLHLITPQDLLFSEKEVETFAKLNKLNYEDHFVKNTFEKAHGWPAAVQLLARKLQNEKFKFSIADALASQTDPLSYLVETIIETITPSDIDALSNLSFIDEFDLEIAELLLDSDSTSHFFARMIADGLIISTQVKNNKTYHLNQIIREALRSRLANSEVSKPFIHKKLANYFLNNKKIGLALFHAHKSNDRDLLQRILKGNIRTIAATGKGDVLLQWSSIIDDKTENGYVRRLSLLIAAHVVNLEFTKAQSLIDELLLLIRESDLRVFLEKSANVSSATINFANGNLSKVNAEVEFVVNPTNAIRDIENIDKLHVLRLLSNKAMALEDYDQCIAIYSRAKEFLTTDYAPLPLYYLQSISAMASFAEGNYYEAFEVTNSGLNIAEMNDYRGISGPVDLHFIRARCLLEFSQTAEALKSFETVKILAIESKQRVWQILAEGYLLRQKILESEITEAFDGIKQQREFLQNLSGSHQLDTFVDANEAFLRYVVEDYDRVLVLLNRMPDGHFVSRFKSVVHDRQGRKQTDDFTKSLPERTPREIIYKHLAAVDFTIDRESEALSYLRKAIDLASLYGAKETLLRQSPSILNLIIKSSGEHPTVYLEELARLAAERLKIQDQNKTKITEALTKREIEILKNLSTGKPISAIGSTLHVSQNTMKTHLRNIYRKLEADGRQSAVDKAKDLFII